MSALTMAGMIPSSFCTKSVAANFYKVYYFLELIIQSFLFHYNFNLSNLKLNCLQFYAQLMTKCAFNIVGLAHWTWARQF